MKRHILSTILGAAALTMFTVGCDSDDDPMSSASGDGGETSDGSGEDHAAWFNPVFVNANGKEINLSSLKWKSAESEWGKAAVWDFLQTLPN